MQFPPMRTMTTSSFAGSGDRDVRRRDPLFRPSSGPVPGPVIFGRFPAFVRLFADFASRAPPFTGIYREIPSNKNEWCPGAESRK